MSTDKVENEEQLNIAYAPVANPVEGVVTLRQMCDSSLYKQSISVIYQEEESTLDEILLPKISVSTTTGKHITSSVDFEGDDTMGANWGLGKERFDKIIVTSFMTEPYAVYQDIPLDNIDKGPVVEGNPERVHRGNKAYLKNGLKIRILKAFMGYSSRVESATHKFNDPAKSPLAILNIYIEKLSKNPTHIVMSRKTFQKIKTNPNTIAETKNKAISAKSWLEDELETKLIITEDEQDNAFIGDKVFLLHTNKNPLKPTAGAIFELKIPFKPMEGSFGQKAGSFICRNIYMPEYGHNGGVRMKTSWENDVKIIEPTLFFVVTDTIDPSIPPYAGGSTGGSGGNGGTDPALVADVNKLKTDVTDLQGEVSTANGKITASEGEINTLKTGLTTAQDVVNTLDGKMSAVEGKVSNQETEIEGIKEDVADHESRLGSLESAPATVDSAEAPKPKK